jgi:hypothetical protein
MPFDGIKWGSPFTGTPGGVVTWSFNVFPSAIFDFDSAITEKIFQIAVAYAFETWESVANIDFVYDPGDANANIVLGWNAIDGAGGTLGATSWVPVNSVRPTWVEIEFDSAENWTANPIVVPDANISNFYATALHEIGHAIGLAHSLIASSIMYPYDGNITLSSFDVGDIQLLYGPSVQPALATVYGTDGPDVMEGNAAGSIVYAGAGSDHIHPGGGDDLINGGDGLDFVQLDGNYGDFIVAANAETEAVALFDARFGSPDGLDAYDEVERLVFDDGVLATDIEGTNGAGAAYRIYQAAFDRTPDVGGLTFWVEQADKGMSTIEMAARFIDSDEFRHLYGSSSPPAEQFIELIYQNVLHRDPDQGGHDYWAGQLAQGMSEAEMLARFADSPENRADVADVIVQGIWLNPEGDYAS